MRIKRYMPKKSLLLNLLSVTLLTSITLGAIVFVLKNPIDVLNAQATPTSYWNVERDASNNLNFSFTNNGSAGAVGLQLIPNGSITANGQITLRQGLTTGSISADSGMSGNRHYQFGYQEPGAWAAPYPDLVLGYHTGMKFGAYTGYGGMKFYADHPSFNNTQLFSVGDGDNNVRVAYNLLFPNLGYGLRSTHNNAYFGPNHLSYGSWRVTGNRNGWGGIEFEAPTTPATPVSLMVGHSSQNSSNIYTGFHNNATGGGWLWYASGRDMYAGTFRDISNGGYYLDPAGSSNLNGATFASGPYTSDWFRINTTGGIYWQNYGGGWYMVDSTYLRSYQNKALLAPSLFDQDNAGYYVDPSNVSNMNYVYTTNGTHLPYAGNNWNYIRGNTYAFNAPWYDENNAGYYIDPASNSVFNRIGIRTNPAADLHIHQTDMSQGGAGGIRLSRPDNGGFARILEGGDQQLYLFTNNNNQYCVVTIGASISCASDRRLKENILPLDGSALDVIEKLKPSTFSWKAGGKKSAGFIAQEVEQVLPDAVSKNPTDGYYSVSDSYLTPYLVKSIQELDINTKQISEQVTKQQTEIEQLKKELSELKEQIQEMKER